VTGAYQADSAFATAVVLTKREVFDALEVCAGAERALLRSGRPAEAAGVASLFELLEDRVVLDPGPRRDDPGPRRDDVGPGRYDAGVAEASGSNSSDSELTQ
jgi:hypothetical protein